MSNQFFDWPAKIAADRFVRFSTVRADDVNAAFDAVSAGFEKMPAPGQLWAGTQNFGVATGPANAWLVTVAPTRLTAYEDGLTIRVRFPADNTLIEPTINLNNLGPRTICRDSGNKVSVGDIATGMVGLLTYSAAFSKFQLTATSANYDDFNDRYLGSKTSDPATNNDGGPIDEGATYWNYALGKLRVYSNSVWNDLIGGLPLASSVTYDGGTVQDVLDGAKSLASYTALRAYTGRSSTVRITGVLGTAQPQGIAGVFQRDNTDLISADNGGTIIVDALGRRWKRVYSGYANVKWWGAVGDGVTSDTAALQAAIGTGLDLEFTRGTYRAANLTANTQFQRFRGSGFAMVMKNANGPILTCSASYVDMQWMDFRGESATPAFTGDNLVITGDSPTLTMCASMWAYGRALKATGNRVQIYGSCGIYQTVDTTANGWDIEIGVSGTATLYHELHGVYTSQHSGGVLLIDTGSHSLMGGQIGKLKIGAGTKPAGTNGGKTVGVRIVGDVTVELSNSQFSSNQFGAVNILLALGTTGITMDSSNAFSLGHTITNLGNGNNIVERQVSAGGFIQYKYGDDISTATVAINLNDRTQQWEYGGSLVIPNNQGLKARDSGNVQRNLAGLSNLNNVGLGYATSNYTSMDGGSLYFATGGASQFQVDVDVLRPVTDNTKYLGGASNRLNTIYAGTGTINTSDRDEKQQIEELTPAEIAVAMRLKKLMRTYRFNDAVAKKGAAARIHVGVIAQDVVAAFEAEGLDAHRYALLCHDTWEEMPEVWDEWADTPEVWDEWEEEPELRDADGNVTRPFKPAGRRLVQQFVPGGRRLVQPRIPAGSRYGIRYEELQAFIVAAL